MGPAVPGVAGTVGLVGKKEWSGQSGGFCAPSGFCADRGDRARVVHIPGSTLLGRRTDFAIFDLAVFRPFEQTIV